MRVLRFTFIRAPRGAIHLAYGKVAHGERVACGGSIGEGWKYGTRARIGGRICRKCLATDKVVKRVYSYGSIK